MKALLPFCFLLIISVANAQMLTKKESAAITALAREVSESHAPHNYVFRNATLLTMTDPVPVKDQDVLIVNGRIKAIDTDLKDVGDAMEIDATGKYLMPGLTDMHVHLFDGHPMKETWTLLLVIHGVTTVRDMNGQSSRLPEREKIKSNALLMPYIYQGGPIITGIKENFMEHASTPEQGRELVKKQKDDGYDFIKVHDRLNKDTYLAIVDEARKQGLKVAGHVPDPVTLSEAFQAKQHTIEHLTGYFEWKNNIEVELTAEADYAQATSASGVWNCPTLFNHLMNISRTALTAELADPASAVFVPHLLMSRWKKPLENVNKQFDALSDVNFTRLKDVVLNLHRAQAPLIAGTDAGSLFFLVPGAALIKELQLLNSIGIPSYDVLKMATTNAAVALEHEGEFGVIAVGARADLILLDQDPLTDLKNLNERSGVMMRGIYFNKQDLQMVAAGIRSAFGN